MGKETCYFHNNQRAVAQCSVCGRYICNKCVYPEGDDTKPKTITCPNCFMNPDAKKKERDIYWFPLVIVLSVIIFIFYFLAQNF